MSKTAEKLLKNIENRDALAGIINLGCVGLPPTP